MWVCTGVCTYVHTHMHTCMYTNTHTHTHSHTHTGHNGAVLALCAHHNVLNNSAVRVDKGVVHESVRGAQTEICGVFAAVLNHDLYACMHACV